MRVSRAKETKKYVRVDTRRSTMIDVYFLWPTARALCICAVTPSLSVLLAQSPTLYLHQAYPQRLYYSTSGCTYLFLHSPQPARDSHVILATVAIAATTPARDLAVSQSVSHYHTPTNGAHGPYTL